MVPVTGMHWFAGEIVDVVQCAAGQYPFGRVPGTRVISRVDANGHFALDVEVRRSFRDNDGHTVDWGGSTA